MSRPIKLRVSYEQDAGFLSRLRGAVELDNRRSTDWKRAMILLLNETIALMITADDTKERYALEVLSRLEAKKPKPKKAS